VWEALLRLSIRSSVFTGVVLVGFLAFSMYGTSHLLVDAVPDITNNQVQVYAYAPGYSASEVELLVTRPLEQALATLPRRVEWRSISRTGLSLITLIFEEGEDLAQARAAILERLMAVGTQLPPGVQPEIGPLSTGLSEAYQYYLVPRMPVSPTELRAVQDWIIRRFLIQVPGVADISSFGGYVRRWEVVADLAALSRYKLTLTDLERTLLQSNQLLGVGYIERQAQTIALRVDGLWRSPEDILRSVVGTYGGRPLLLRDVARVEEGHLPRYGALVKDTLGEVVGGIVLVRKGENTAQVVSRLKAEIARLEPQLPYGIRVVPFLNREELIERVLATASTNLLEAALIVVALLTLLLGSWRAGLIVGLVIPLSMFFALAGLYFSGESANLMSLGAIDFGLIVDGSVILVEAVLTRLLTEKDRRLATEVASIRIRQASLFGELVVLSVYVPLLFLRGVEGKMFRPMVLTMVYALLGALILSLTLIPWLSAQFLRPHGSQKPPLSEQFFEKMRELTWQAYRFSMRRPYLPLLAWGVWVGLGGYLLRVSDAVFLPELNEGDFAVETRLPPGVALSETITYCERISRLLLDKMGWAFSQVVAKIGTSEIPMDPMFVESADLIVHIRPDAPLARAELADSMKALLTAHFPGIFFGVQQPIQMRFNELLAGARTDIVIKLVGPNLDTLMTYGEQLAQLCEGIPGVADISRPLFFGATAVEVRWRPELLTFYGVDLGEAQRRVQAFRIGLPLREVYAGERRISTALRLGVSPSLAQLEALPIPTGSGSYVPLSSIAEVRLVPSYNEIPHANGERAYILGINVRGRGALPVVEDIQARAKKLTLPAGYFIQYGGQWQTYQEARLRLLWIGPLTILSVAMLMYFTLRRWGAVGLVLVVSLSAPAGGMVALALRGLPFSFSAAIGLVSVLGLATLNGTVLLNRIQTLSRHPVTLHRHLRVALHERVRPILVTMLLAVVGFVPMAFSMQAGAEVQRPLATVVIGGLLSGAFFNLWLLPVAYTTLYRKQTP
jgi:cobalt-zinc-cadmium resistance protein CzcA